MPPRFYTPPPVAHRLVALVVEAAGGRLPDGPVLEPSVGAGALVLAWLDHAAGPVTDPDAAGRAADLVRTRLRALDADPEAVAATRRALQLRCAPHLPPDDPALSRVRVGDGWSAPAELAAVILANPPWGSYSGRQAGRAGAPGDGPRPSGVTTGWPAYHTRAVLGLLEHLRADGVAGFVLPGQVATLRGYGAFRRALAARVRHVEHLGEGAFPGIESPACLVIVGPAGPGPLQVRRGGHVESIPREALTADPVRPWLSRLEDRFAAWPPPGFVLSPAAFGDVGLHSGNAASTLFSRHPFPGAQPVLEGRDVRPFVVGAPRLWFDPRAVPAPGQYFHVAHWERSRAMPIVLRQTAPRPVAALNPGVAFRNSVLGCRGVPGLETTTVVALLNSEALARVYAALSPDACQRTFPQVKVGDLARLPWPASPESRKRLESMLRSGGFDAVARVASDVYAPVLDGAGSGEP